MPQDIDNIRLAQIAQRAAKRLPEMIGDGEDLILDDYKDAVEQAHEQSADKLPKLKFAFAVSFDTQTSALECDLKWTVTRVLKEVDELEDPDQAELPLEPQPDPKRKRRASTAS